MVKRRWVSRPKKLAVDPGDVVSIVADASIAGPVADGRMIPLVIVDTTDRIDLDELVRLHTHLSPGDVGYRWGQVDRHDDLVALHLRFTRPAEMSAILVFSIEHQGILVDIALRSGAIYLQPGRPGDRLKQDPDRPKLLIEVPDDRFRGQWDDIALRRLTAVIRRDQRIARSEARQLAREWLERMREFTGLRMPTRKHHAGRYHDRGGG